LSGISKEELKKIIEEEVDEQYINKKMKAVTKADAVFLLLVNGAVAGTCFAIDEIHVLSARHNMFDNTANFDTNITAEIVNSLTMASTFIVRPSPIPVKIIACKNPPPGGSISASDDWIVLERTDRSKFDSAFSVIPTNDEQLNRRRPHITIYHFPDSVDSYYLRSSYNRVIGAENGQLRCNDLSEVSKTSCGGPYVDDLNGTAIGFHLRGISYDEKGTNTMKKLPRGFHFEVNSSLMVALADIRSY